MSSLREFSIIDNSVLIPITDESNACVLTASPIVFAERLILERRLFTPPSPSSLSIIAYVES